MPYCRARVAGLRPGLRFVLGLLGATLPLGAAGAQDFHVVLRRVAMQGDQVPGAPAGVLMFDAAPERNFPVAPTMDRDGSVSFHAVLFGPGVDTTNRDALLKEVGGQLVMTARQGSQAPGTAPGVLFDGFPSLMFGAASPSTLLGRSVFMGGLRGPGVDTTFSSNFLGIWSDRAGPLQLLVRNADPAPGSGPDAVFNGMAFPGCDTAGRIVFNALWRRSTDSPGGSDPNREGLWSDRSGPLQRIIGGGDPAPGTAPGVVFQQSTQFAVGGVLRGWDVDDAGRVAFHGNLGGPGITDFNDEGIWSEASGSLALVIREGQHAPGFQSQSTHIGSSNGIDAFESPMPILVNGAGKIVFQARVSGGGVGFANALYTNRSGPIELIAEGRDAGANPPGDPAPGFPGRHFTGFILATLSPAPAQRVAFLGSITGPFTNGDIFDHGVWWDQPGALSLVAGDRVQIPDQPPGVLFGTPVGVNSNTYGLGPLSADGRLLFTAPFHGAASGSGVFMTDPSGAVRTVLRTGQSIDIGDGVMRTISDILTGGTSAGGEVAMKLLFTNGSIGLFTARLATDCPADFNGDGFVDGIDYDQFNNAFENGDPTADFNGDGFVDGIDYDQFHIAFEAGC